LERAKHGFNTVCARHYLSTPRRKMSSSVRRPTNCAGITLVRLKRRRSSARNDAAICLSSNRHDRGNEQQTSGVARLASRGAVSARGGSKSKSSMRSDKAQPKMIPKVSMGSSSFPGKQNIRRKPPLTHSHIRRSRESRNPGISVTCSWVPRFRAGVSGAIRRPSLRKSASEVSRTRRLLTLPRRPGERAR
jgi:hypothetical protein